MPLPTTSTGGGATNTPARYYRIRLQPKSGQNGRPGGGFAITAAFTCSRRSRKSSKNSNQVGPVVCNLEGLVSWMIRAISLRIAVAIRSLVERKLINYSLVPTTS